MTIAEILRQVNTMISREEAIFELSLVKAVVLDPDFNSRAVKAVDMAIEALFHERPKGRWVRRPNVLGTDYYGHCSECDCTDPLERTNRGKPNFCPNCGADMRGEEDDNS
jgi:hypothetical protein